MKICIATAFLLAGCVSPNQYEEMRHQRDDARRELEQAQMFIAGAHEDNAALQKYGIALEEELLRWQRGSMLQAKREADLRRSCDI